MIKRLLILLTASLFLYSCSTTKQASQDSNQQETAEQQTQVPDSVDFATMLEPPQGWHQLDEERTRFRGISSDWAYQNLLNKKSPKKEVVVAVIDGGVDIQHEDLKNVIWVNKDEIPNNQKDDDQNGYVDDVHGWNFIGGPDGQNVNHDTFELTRIYRDLHQKFADTDTSSLSQKEQQKYAYYQQIKSDYGKEIRELQQQYNNIESLENSMKEANQILMEHFGTSSYSYEDVKNLQPDNQELMFAQNVMGYVMENDIDSTLIADQKKQIYEFAKYGYNPDFNPRTIVGDNYEDKTERHYGNNDVEGPDPSHGTHVAGIIAAQRNNGIGMNGIATNTKIMVVRTVPNGDERDKDVANAIRYAVDNGADVINMSFGKGYSPYKEEVDRAVQYADEHGVLMIHAAGNEAQNTDQKPSYPTDTYGSVLSDSSATLWLSVGASNWKPNEQFIANFSNYGDQTVDLFAPGVDIYSTMPDNQYKFQEGTSMAAPVVSGSAALIMAYYPQFTAQQIRELLINNVIRYPNQEVIVPNEGNPTESERKLFPQLSVSDGEINVYKALQAAEKMQ